jgi:hypothetical protein
MRVPRFRLRLRTLMIAVAVVGALFALSIEARRLSQVSLGHRKRAQLMRLEEEYWASKAKSHEAMIRAIEATDANNEVKREQISATAARLRIGFGMAMTDRNVTHFKTLRLKYERAARYPWLSVPPDPQPPK